MHIQVSRVRYKGTIRSYCRVVESYRRDDGVPATRIVANLGQLDPLLVENLRETFRTSRAGKRVVGASITPLRPAENLRFLDIAVLRELARRFGLERLLQDLLPQGDSDMSPADVVLALSLQRCVDPGSKLFATQWFPTTALPELLRVEAATFNNTRIHRVLDALHKVNTTLMGRLPLLYGEQGIPASAMFLDCTDAKFVGRGPQLAEMGKTKEGLFSLKIGIMLLCNKEGLPLRWEVMSGKTAEAPVMHQMLTSIRGLPWLGNAPIVIDRIMGAAADVKKLLSSGIRFLTAARLNEFGAYAPKLAHAKFAALRCVAHASEEQLTACAKGAEEQIQELGFTKVSSSLWISDLGIVERGLQEVIERSPDCDFGMSVVRSAREMKRLVESGQVDSTKTAGARLGLSKTKSGRYSQALGLDVELQNEILEGKFLGLTLTDLRRIGSLSDAQEQRRELQRKAKTNSRSVPAPPPPKSDAAEAIKVRVVMCFNPSRFARQRSHAQRKLDQIQAEFGALNQRLANSSQQQTTERVRRTAERMLEKKKALRFYQIRVEQVSKDSKVHLAVSLKLDLRRWEQRRRYDGFALNLAHPALPETAIELATLYREKDRVEKDFQTIKGLLELRPIWHHTDAKVRAHVTLCILALLLERLLARNLPKGMSPVTAIEILKTCQLNRYDGHKQSNYLLTQCSRQQQQLLSVLDMKSLADDNALAAEIRPRGVL